MRKGIAIGVGCAVLVLSLLMLCFRNGKDHSPVTAVPPVKHDPPPTVVGRPVQAGMVRVTRVREHANVATAKRPSLQREELLEKILCAADDRAVSKTVRTAIGIETERGYAKRIRAVHELPHTLPPKAIEVLSLFLQTPYNKESGLREIEHEALRNDVVEKLVRQDVLPPGLGTLLVDMFRDPNQGDVWRDYCVQFFSTYYTRKWKTDEVDEGDSERAAILQAYDDALRETDKTIAGTALLAVDRLSADYGEFDRGAITSNAVHLASDDNAFAPIRMTALLVCEQHGTREVLPAARILAQTGENTHLRMVAVKTLGSLGETQDIELLNAMAKDRDTNVAAVAVMALARVGGERRE
jgi:hypothetical protein